VFTKILTSVTIYFAYHELSCTWLRLAIGSRTALHSVPINHLKQVQYVEPKEDHNFPVTISATLQLLIQVCLLYLREST